MEAVLDRHRITVSGIAGFAVGWFDFGHAQWTDGGRAGLADAIVRQSREGDADIIAFDRPVGDFVMAGDALVVRAGCDRRLATCAAKFANVANFRGFPHIPGSDFLLRLPRQGDDLGGGSLFR